MKKFKYFIVFALAILVINQANAQNRMLRFMTGQRDDSGISYNFFLGDDAEDFATSINGFGSGFVFDVLTGRQSFDIISIGPRVANLSLGAGLAISKYRFQENIVLDKVDGIVTWTTDMDENHDYVNSFFGYGKSKLVTASVFFPAYLNFTIGESLLISAGGFIDLYFYGKHKRKFKDEDGKQKILIEPDTFKDYNLNKTKYGINVSITHKQSGIGISGTYFLTPFFQDGMGPELNEARISLSFNTNAFMGLSGHK